MKVYKRLFLCLVFCFLMCFNSFASTITSEEAKNMTYELYHEDRLSRLSYDEALLDRDFLLYLYSTGLIDSDEFDRCIEKGILVYTNLPQGELFRTYRGYRVNLDNIKENEEVYPLESSYIYKSRSMETIAALVMEKMYDDMPVDLQNLSMDSNGNFIVPGSTFSNENPWYLCPYGCGGVGTKVTSWGAVCKKLGVEHRLSDDEALFSDILVPTYVLDEKTGKHNLKNKTIRVRRDCSNYVAAVLAHLGYDGFLLDDLLSISTESIKNLSYKDLGDNFEILDYNINDLKIGDIVVYRVNNTGHTEIFMGFQSKVDTLNGKLPFVRKFSWGSTTPVYKNKYSYNNNIYFRAYRYIDDEHYNGYNKKIKYQKIIRYIPNI